MKIEARGIGPHAVAPAPKQLVKRQADLFGRKVPQRHLHGLLEGQGGGAPVAAARAVDPVNERRRRLTLEARPHLTLEDADDLIARGERAVQVLHEPETRPALLVKQFDGSDAGVVHANLAVANDAIACKLESSDLKRRNTHGGRPDVTMIYHTVRCNRPQA